MAVQPVRGVVTVAAALAQQRVGVDTPWDRCAAQTGEPRGGLVCAAGGRLLASQVNETAVFHWGWWAT